MVNTTKANTDVRPYMSFVPKHIKGEHVGSPLHNLKGQTQGFAPTNSML